jgi:tetratricopeptide (TPR) repeat protein
MNNLALTLRGQGDLEGARDLHEQALDAYRRVLGDGHLHTLGSMNNLAVTLEDHGDLEGARDLHEQALDASRRVLGDEHPYTRTSGRAPDAQLD